MEKPDATETSKSDNWILTQSGVEFPLAIVDLEKINVEDIAHALSNLCRFTGHTRTFYSVAEHSIQVSHVCDPEDALWGLLHDASEAYLGDVSSPLKYLPCMEGYRAIEKGLQTAIVSSFGLAPEEPASVKMADRVLLGVEAALLMPPNPAWRPYVQDVLFSKRTFTIGEPMPPVRAARKFMERYEDLMQRGGAAAFGGWR